MASIRGSVPLAAASDLARLRARTALEVCHRCGQPLVNGMIGTYTGSAKALVSTECLRCYASANPISAAFDSLYTEESLRASDDNVRHARLRFRFEETTQLLAKLDRLLPKSASVVQIAQPPRLHLADVTRLLSHLVRQQRSLDDHTVCTAAAAVLAHERIRSAEVRDLLQRLRDDVVQFCHPSDPLRAACPLAAAPELAATKSEMRRVRTCGPQCSAPEGEALYLCASAAHRDTSPVFHLSCSDFGAAAKSAKPPPASASLICCVCLRAWRPGVATAQLCDEHLWDRVGAPRELHRAGYEAVEGERLSLPLLMYLLAQGYDARTYTRTPNLGCTDT